MRKIFPIFFLMAVGLVPTCVNAACEARPVSFKGFQTPKDNEFLYKNENEFTLAKDDYYYHRKDANGHAYECGVCSYKSTVTLPAGHVFKGNVINKARTYECNGQTSFEDDFWKVIESKVNANCPLKGGDYAETGHKISAGTCSPSNASTGLASTEHVKSGNVCNLECVTGGWNVKLNSDACDSTDYEPDSTGKKCVLKKNTGTENVVITVDNGGQRNCSVDRNCASNPNAAECYICCATPKSLTQWNSSTNKCECVAPNMKFTVTAPYCVANDAPVTQPVAGGTFKCDEEKLIQLAGWRGKYASNEKIIAKIDEIIKTCNDNKYAAQVEFEMAFAELGALIAQIDADIAAADAAAAAAAREKREQMAQQAASRPKIIAASDKMKELVGGLGLSVWKTADGNFNGARLASDSVAGVVLGTAGGLITSNVVKKNQIKHGFEDIKCAIGGQNVADYGDDFTVGVK